MKVLSEYVMKRTNYYGSEMGNHPFPRSERSIRALATYRGSTSSCHYAESFMLLKEII